MRLLIAPDKFKSCLSAAQVADAIAMGARDAIPQCEIDLCPMTDGGEGFVDTIAQATGARRLSARVTGPVPDMSVDATFAILESPDGAKPTAILEMSSASGIALLKNQPLDPETTTTFGVGELLRAAVDHGCGTILLGIGGSATIDAGIGCCQSAGLNVLLDDGEPTSLTEPLCGRDLPRVVLIKSRRGENLSGANIIVACDVDNPLFGPNGASAVYGPQKGATAQQVVQFDEWLRQLARRCGKQTEADTPGAGAAGGMGFAMLAFFDATLRPGAAMVMDAVRLNERLRAVDLCITGEGSLDASSLRGKTTIAIARACADAKVPCSAIAGRVDRSIDLPFQHVVGLTDTVPESDAVCNAAAHLRDATARLLRRVG
jgi:glycerate kinase